MSKLSIGGMEKALVDLLNNSNLVNNYDITLMLVYNNQKNYLDSISKKINVEIIYKGEWNIFGKIISSFKLLKEYIFPKKYYASICYTHHHGILAKITRRESDNNIIFIHTDLLKSRTEKELNKLKRSVRFDKFKKIVCVSECAKESFLKIVPNYNGKIVVANNYIAGSEIINKSKKVITDVKKEDIITLVNVARHDDEHKKISRIIESTYKLNKENYNFRVLLIGEGKDTDLYKNMIKEKNISNIEILGSKENPFPYYSISSAFLFTSSYEGYGIVLNEARVLGIPIITTDVADAKYITEEGYGILCDNSSEGVYNGMKEFLENGYEIKKKFDYKKFNSVITKTIDDIVKE